MGTTITEAIAEIKESLGFLDHVADLQHAAKEEQRRREQFCQDLDEDTKAEFINGRVVMHSPVRRRHLQASFYISNLLGGFVLSRKIGEVYTEKCLIRCQRNDYEPNVCFFSAAKCAQLEEDQLIFPPPDLIVEVLSPSTEHIDRTVKLHDYARHGVGEYWIVDADARTVEQHVLPPGREGYAPGALLNSPAQIASSVLPGFAVPVAALFDLQEYLRALLLVTTGPEA